MGEIRKFICKSTGFYTNNKCFCHVYVNSFRTPSKRNILAVSNCCKEPLPLCSQQHNPKVSLPTALVEKVPLFSPFLTLNFTRATSSHVQTPRLSICGAPSFFLCSSRHPGAPPRLSVQKWETGRNGRTVYQGYWIFIMRTCWGWTGGWWGRMWRRRAGRMCRSILRGWRILRVGRWRVSWFASFLYWYLLRNII